MAEPRDRSTSGTGPQPQRSRPEVGSVDTPAADARSVELTIRAWQRWHGDEVGPTPSVTPAVAPADVARVLAVVDAIAAARRTESSR